MDVILLSRLQFAITTIFHFLFVPLSISLGLFVAIIETMYVRTGKEEYKKLAQFWGKLFLINFAVGIVTGILQEFQFGMNWSDYSRFVGDVFGAPLAIEALLAFFMESTFLGIWIFGWDRLSKRLHLMCIWLVAIGTMISAFWILLANSFMQHPVGFEVNNGRAEMNDFFALLKNGQLWVEFPHTIFGALLTGAALVFGVCAWMIFKKRHVEIFKKNLMIATVIGLIGFFGAAFSGHGQAQYLVQTQPMKMAATEGVWTTTGSPAPWAAIAGIDVKNQKNTWELNVPGLLSFLSYSKFSGEVKGMKELQAEYTEKYGEGDYIPPVRTSFWSFRIMIIAAMLSFLIFAYALYLFKTKKWENNNKWFTRFALWAIALPFISNTAGWVMTEVGRQPWTVFGLMQTKDSVSPNVTSGQVLFSIISFSTIYAILGIVMAYLFVKVIKKGPFATKEEAPIAKDPFSDTLNKGGSRVVS